ncbi:MAG: hypothetical protein JWR26_2543 [Pedosphaera sp.]|nr:hypothetical protein [Pedosphaera sp.]
MTLIVSIAIVCCVVAAFFSMYFYTLHMFDETARPGLEAKYQELEYRVKYLETHNPGDRIPVHMWGEISTTDHPAQFSMVTESGDGGTNVIYRASLAKGMDITPEFRLEAGSTAKQEFDIHVNSQFGTVADAWLSRGEPYTDLAAFDEFHAYCPNRTNVVRLVVQPKAGASIKMRFDLTILCNRPAEWRHQVP